MPAPLASDRTYFVRNVSGHTFQVAYESDGPPIDLTTAGNNHPIEVGPPRLYHFSPLGNPAPLFQKPELLEDDTGLAGEILDDEWGAEVFYNYAITPAIQASLDLQYIDSAVATVDSAFVVGLRLFTQF